MKRSRLPLLVALLVVVADTGIAQAQTVEPGNGLEANSAKAADDWKFAIVPYAWLAGAKGDVDVIEPVEPVGLDLSFGDVIDSFKFAFMGSAEAQKGRLVLLGDMTFIHLQAGHGINIRDQNFIDAELDSQTIDITALGGYRVTGDDTIAVDLLGGMRANFFKNTLQLDGPNQSLEGEKQETWFDPLLACRATIPIGGKWGLSLYGDIGGFGIASDLTWQMQATVDYNINERFRLMAGWRHFKVDYDKGDFLYDVAQSGLYLGLRVQM